MDQTLLVDMKYAPLLAGRTRNFKTKSANVYNCSCPICGDSHKKSSKARFYVYPKAGSLRVTCHNCGYSSRLGRFLKEHMPDLYQQYCFDLIADNKREVQPKPIVTPNRAKVEKDVLRGLLRVSQLSHEHPAKQYIVDRKLPTPSHAFLYYTPNFTRWLNRLDPENVRRESQHDPRIVIPLFDVNGEVFAVQGRAIAGQHDRYITHKFYDHLKIFGINRINPNRNVKVLEGPFDSLFVTNAIAMAGGDVSLDELCECLHTTKERLVFVYDNEPRKRETVERMRKVIRSGAKIVIWPKWMTQKDLNAAILAGEIAPAEVDLVIDKHTFSGLEAQLQFALWSKV